MTNRSGTRGAAEVSGAMEVAGASEVIGPDDDVGSVHIDCDGCAMRRIACGDCVVTVLLGQPPATWDDEEQRAIAVLAESGLVPPLRLVRGDGASMHRTRGYRPRQRDAAG